jgi:hypothetical protein
MFRSRVVPLRNFSLALALLCAVASGLMRSGRAMCTSR